MFRLLITIATLLTTGAHALFGCCWHHDHGTPHAVCEGDWPTRSHQVADVEPSCGCGRACQSEPRENAEEPGPLSISAVACSDACPCGDSQDNDSPPCEEVRCQYLVNAKVEPPSGTDSRQVLFSAIPPTVQNAELLRGDRTGMRLPHRLVSLLFGSLCVRDVTQIALI